MASLAFLEPSEAACAELAAIEKEIVAQLASRSVADRNVFSKMLTTREAEERFVSCLKTSARGRNFIKLKVDPENMLEDPEGARQAAPGLDDVRPVRAPRATRRTLQSPGG